MKDARLRPILVAIQNTQLNTPVDIVVGVLRVYGTDMIDVTVYIKDMNGKSVKDKYEYGLESVHFYSKDSSSELADKVKKFDSAVREAKLWIHKEL